MVIGQDTIFSVIVLSLEMGGIWRQVNYFLRNVHQAKATEKIRGKGQTKKTRRCKRTLFFELIRTMAVPIKKGSFFCPEISWVQYMEYLSTKI